jgi:hypothetical protein
MLIYLIYVYRLLWATKGQRNIEGQWNQKVTKVLIIFGHLMFVLLIFLALMSMLF